MTNETKKMIGRVLGIVILLWVVTTTVLLVASVFMAEPMLAVVAFGGALGAIGWIGIAHSIHASLYK